jgi:hypothetical protein
LLISYYHRQARHTYALYEAGYGIMNEHQLAMGESTCAARFWAAPTIAGGAARVEVRDKIRTEHKSNEMILKRGKTKTTQKN